MRKVVRVTRFAACPWGTYGAASIEGTAFDAFSVERPWRDNKRVESCIPAGEYDLQLDMYFGGDGVGGRRDYPAYELVGVPNREEIKLHIFNAPNESKGCIGLGNAPGWHKGQWSVLDSGVTYKKFMEVMSGDERALLIVRWLVQP